MSRTIGPAWKEVLNWLREADQVQTLAIDGESFVFEESPADYRAFMNERAKDSNWMIQDIEGESLNRAVNFVESCLFETQAASGCIFRPHHYVIGRKDSESLVLHLCFECGLAHAMGVIESEGYIQCENLDEATSIFGIRPNRSSQDNRITYFPPPDSKPKQTWPIGGN